MFKYCPSCADTRIEFDGKKFHCPGCGFTYYHNTAAATGCIIQADDKVVLLVRGKEPSAGKLDLPGGFVDPGEGLLEGLYRELKEELNWEPTIPKGSSLAEFFTLFASFPNIYLYKNIPYNTCDVYFTISVPSLSEADLHPEAGEVTAIRFVGLEEIDLNDMAFDSTRRAMAAFLEYKKRDSFSQSYLLA
jgi:ADP-ribose pyrophosphatase YjhB (NUDIX family)